MLHIWYTAYLNFTTNSTRADAGFYEDSKCLLFYWLNHRFHAEIIGKFLKFIVHMLEYFYNVALNTASKKTPSDSSLITY